MIVSIREKEKAIKSAIESAFLKNETIWKELILEDILMQTGIGTNKTMKIKIEVDRNPPLHFETEQKLILRPFSTYVKCFTLPCLFAGKMHALLFRKWKNRVKGRDWYDMEWYIRKGIPLNISHFIQRAKDSNDWQEEQITEEQIRSLLHQKIDQVSFDQIRTDVIRFIPNTEKISIWSVNYFHDLIGKMRME